MQAESNMQRVLQWLLAGLFQGIIRLIADIVHYVCFQISIVNTSVMLKYASKLKSDVKKKTVKAWMIKLSHVLT